MRIANLALAAFMAALGGFLPAPAANACGPDTNCTVGDRHYRIRMPEDHDGKTPIGAVIFAHGYRGSADGAIHNPALNRFAADLGIAFIAVKSKGPGWALPGTPSQLDATGDEELAYFRTVIDDAAHRFAIDKDKIVATGFSAGGMMVWTLACRDSARFAGFIPMSGTFWTPIPETCTSPAANIVHVHGDQDRTVPLSGRRIARAHQGDVPDTIAMYARYGGFGAPADAQIDDLRCQNRQNAQGRILDFCLFEGGHSFRVRYLRHAWNTLVQAGAL